MDNTIQKVISLYYEETPGGDLYNRSEEYKKRDDTFKELLAKSPDGAALGAAAFELMAITEKLCFEDGFKAAIKHVKGLYDLPCE